MTCGSNLAECLAFQLEEGINQVAEPYRSRLIAWISKHADRDLSSSNGALAEYLDEFGSLDMFDQYQLLRIVINRATKIFGDKK